MQILNDQLKLLVDDVDRIEKKISKAHIHESKLLHRGLKERSQNFNPCIFDESMVFSVFKNENDENENYENL